MTGSNKGSPSEIRSFLVLIALLVVTGFIASLIAGCSGRVVGDGWVHETTEDGAIRTVRTVSGSVWGGPGRFVEEASIGVREGADEYMLGRVRSIHVYDGQIFLLDGQVPVLRVYDLAGVHLRDIGGGGAGPGEFEDPRSITIDPGDGTIYVRDGSLGRIIRFTAEGSPIDAWPLMAGISTGTQMVMSADGNVYTPVYRIDFEIDLFTKGMARIGPEGATGDTIYGPESDFEEKDWEVEVRSEDGQSVSIDLVPFSPDEMWVLCPDGSVVGGVSEEYRFEIHSPAGGITVVETTSERVPVEPGEARWYRNRLIADFRTVLPGWAWPAGRGIPRFKPAYAQLIPDQSRRVWVRRQGPGINIEGCDENPEDSSRFYSDPCWQDTFTFDVFDLDGRYLGEVDVPDGLLARPDPYIEGDMMVALVQDEEGVQYVKRYRLVLSEENDES
ncbi:6-bladed beta-propeller [Gemmatimonadota bacterium]